MAHFPHHLGAAPLVHGSPMGISQVGIGPTGHRVYIDPARGRGEGTEVRLRPSSQTLAVNRMASVTVQDVVGVGCEFLPEGSPEKLLCQVLADVIPGGGSDGGDIPGTDGGCPIPLIQDADGECRHPGSPADIDVGGAMGGAAVMGRYGAALAPSTESRIHRDCLPGMVLGDDNLCYNRRSIRNSDRKYPRGARPLGTPGEMSALRKAASFGRRMETTVKRMQKIGVLRKPAPRKASPKPKQLVSGPGITVVDTS